MLPCGGLVLFLSGVCRLVVAFFAGSSVDGEAEVFCFGDSIPPLFIGSTNADENNAGVGVCWLLASGFMRLQADFCGC